MCENTPLELAQLGARSPQSKDRQLAATLFYAVVVVDILANTQAITYALAAMAIDTETAPAMSSASCERCCSVSVVQYHVCLMCGTEPTQDIELKVTSIFL